MFRFPIPTGTAPYLKKQFIVKEEDLIEFIERGVLNEALLKEYSLSACVQTLIYRNHIKYEFFRDMIKDEEHALDHFYDHFSDRTNLILKQNLVRDADDLKNFIEIKKMKARGLGKKGKSEVIDVWGSHFSTRT